MIIKVIFAQRKESYEGQYAPEALEAMDEYGYEENPDWLHGKLEKYKKDSSIASVKIIDIKVNGNDIKNILTSTPMVEGEIKS